MNEVTVSLILDLARLISNKIKLDDFLSLHLEYYGFNGELYKNIIPKLKMILGSVTGTNEDEFAEFMMGLISLSDYSFILIDKFLELNIVAIKNLNEILIEDDYLR